MLSVPLVNWLGKAYTGDRLRMMSILVIAMILVLFTYIHVWAGAKNISVVKHVKSNLEIMSITLVIYCLLSYMELEHGSAVSLVSN
jgi:ABC-type xylose transport system permease subunit